MSRGRPKNTIRKSSIANAAYQLFIRNGYNNTTYKDIAISSGNEQTIVQHYFPKKEHVLINFINEILSLSRNYVESSLSTSDELINLYMIGQVHFSFLLMNKEMKQLTSEIVASRDFTDEVISFNEEWALSFLETDTNYKKEISDVIVMSMGGAYELIYRYLNKGEVIGVPWLMQKIIIPLLLSLGYNNSKAVELLTEYALNEQELIKANNYLWNSLFEVVNE